MTSRPASRSRSHGQALAEFALVLPVLLLILLGIFDAGRMVYAYNAVANAAREGGRTAIVNQTPATIRDKAAQQATALGIPTSAPSGCPPTGGPTTDPAGVCVVFRSGNGLDPCPDPAVIGCTAVVSVKWQYKALVPIISDILGPIDLVSTTQQAIEHVCDGLPTCPVR